MDEKFRTLTNPERFDWLRLIRSENVGPVTFHQLLSRYPTAAEALAALPALARHGGRRRPIKIAAKADIEKEFEAMARVGAHFVALGERAYPKALATISDSPPLFSMIGHPVLAERAIFAIVGARNAPANALRLTEEIARDLGKHQMVVASGMARGIDAAAHRGALESGTIAVLAGGVDHIYPPENEALYRQICDGGLALSEMPIGTKAQARHFPRRNRLVSGMAHGVLVVHAAMKSGTLITARFALEQGREVFAVPGFPSDPRCRGSNQLLKDGACLTENANDIMAVLAPMLNRPFADPVGTDYGGTPPIADKDIDDARGRVQELLSPSPTAVDEILRLSGIPPAIVLTVLLELELAGRLQRHSGQRVSLT